MRQFIKASASTSSPNIITKKLEITYSWGGFGLVSGLVIGLVGDDLGIRLGVGWVRSVRLGVGWVWVGLGVGWKYDKIYMNSRTYYGMGSTTAK